MVVLKRVRTGLLGLIEAEGLQEVEEDISEVKEEVLTVQEEILMILEVIAQMIRGSFSQVNNIVEEVKGSSIEHQLVKGVVEVIIKMFSVIIVESMDTLGLIVG